VVADSGRQFHALLAAATIHFGLGLWALYQRRHFQAYSAIEATQLVFGLSIPLLARSISDRATGGVMFDQTRRTMQASWSPIGLSVPT